jgi:hypothetical protein
MKMSVSLQTDVLTRLVGMIKLSLSYAQRTIAQFDVLQTLGTETEGVCMHRTSLINICWKPSCGRMKARLIYFLSGSTEDTMARATETATTLSRIRHPTQVT